MQRTNAASSGVKIDGRTLKGMTARSDRPGLIYLAQWLVALMGTGAVVWATRGTVWMWPAMFVYGIFLCVPAYAASHETAHGTAFKTRWLNETVLWVTSLIYMEEPLHRRYTHTSHHSYTWHVEKDAQMPFDTPMDFRGWVAEITGFGLARFHLQAFWHIATRRYTPMMREVIPASEFDRMTLNARAMLAIYAAIAIAPFFGIWWPMWFVAVPRVLGAPVMLLFTLIQHVELQENSPSILDSTRSFRTTWLARFLYMNMNNHVEHHLYPQVPFYALPQLSEAVKDQVPAPDPGFFQTNWEVLSVVMRRTLGRQTKAATIRQAPHMITQGGPVERVAQRTM